MAPPVQLSLDFAVKNHANDTVASDGRQAKSLVWTIYCHRNKVNGKRYIGQTMQGMIKRWRCHVSPKVGQCPFLAAAILKHGADAFEHEVLEECATQESADDAERKWIAHYRSTDREFGYNLAVGGRTGGGTPRDWPSEEEMRERIRGMDTREYHKKHAALGGPATSNFTSAYGKTFLEVRDGIRGPVRPTLIRGSGMSHEELLSVLASFHGSHGALAQAARISGSALNAYIKNRNRDISSNAELSARIREAAKTPPSADHLSSVRRCAYERRRNAPPGVAEHRLGRVVGHVPQSA